MNQKQTFYKPWGILEDAIYCHDGEVLIEGPVRTGKTRAILEKCFVVAQKHRGCRILWVRKTQASMAESVLQTWEDQVLPPGFYLHNGPSRRFRQTYKFRNTSLIVCGGMDKSTRFLSTEYDIICVFEATEITEHDWEILLTRANNGVVPYNQCIADCNPSAPSHWLNARASKGTMTRFRSRLQDNPKFYDHGSECWTQAGETLLSKLEMLSGPRYQRFRRGIWSAAEGLVYENYDPAIHVIERRELPENWLRFCSIDFGYVNPLVCQWWAVDGENNAYLYREIYQTHKLVKDHAELIKQLTGNECIETHITDHEAEQRQVLHEQDIFTTAADKRIEAGVQAVTHQMGNKQGRPAKLFLFRDALVARDEQLVDAHKPTCTIEEIENYTYNQLSESSTKAAKETPAKVDDHGMDAMRYGMMWLSKYLGLNWTEEEAEPAEREHDDAALASGDLIEQVDDDDDEYDTFDAIMTNEAAWR